MQNQAKSKIAPCEDEPSPPVLGTENGGFSLLPITSAVNQHMHKVVVSPFQGNPTGGGCGTMLCTKFQPPPPA